MRRWHQRYGDAFTISMPVVGTLFVVSHPDLVKQVFTAKPTVLHGGKNLLGKMLGPGSLFSMDEDRHLDEKRMLLPSFHGERLRSYEGLIEEETLRSMASWPEDEEFASIKTFNAIALRVILRAVFGAEGRELAELQKIIPPGVALGQRLVTFRQLGRDLGRWSPGGRLKRMRQRYLVLVETLIDNHLADPDLDDRIDILAHMLRTMRERGDEINRSDIADELLTLLVAGHETTASTLAWSVERIRRHPEVVRRLEEEATGEDATYRTATINEVLRVRPVIDSTARVAVKPFELGEWRVPPRTVLVPSIGWVNQDERFHGEARRFDPERYVGRKPDTYAWIPFGGGMRRCLGAAFAMIEMDLVLRTMLRQFELIPTDEPSERPSFRGLTYAPAKGGRIMVRRRPLALDPVREDAEPVTA
jgi:cytochrome P450 family 138